MRLLPWPCGDQHLLEMIVLAVMIEEFALERLEDDLSCLAVDLGRLPRLDPETGDLDRRGAAAEAQFEAPAAHMVEHDHFLGDAQRMVHRRYIEQRPETQPLRPLRHGGEEDAGRRRHA